VTVSAFIPLSLSIQKHPLWPVSLGRAQRARLKLDIKLNKNLTVTKVAGEIHLATGFSNVGGDATHRPKEWLNYL